MTPASTVEVGGRAYLSLVPTQLGRALDAGVRLDGYAAVLVGGAACPPALVERARAAGVRVVLSYGMTETCGGCVYDGEPLPGVEVAVGADGRIAVGGATLFAGYRFGPPQVGPHVTGDLGALDDSGRLTVLGRADDVIVTGGENVSPQAVEAALAAHPAVREAAVVGAPDPEWGQAVVAYVVLAPVRRAADAGRRARVGGAPGSGGPRRRARCGWWPSCRG